jgi:hypothetical protein
MGSIDLKTKVKLQGLSFNKIKIDGQFLTSGFVISGKSFLVTIDNHVGTCIISNGTLYNLSSSEHDDFYAIVEE